MPEIQEKEVSQTPGLRPWRRTMALGAVAAISGLTLVACGSSGNATSTNAAGSSAAGSKTTTAPAAKPAKLTSITMAIAANAPAFSPVFVAQAAGIFKKNGLSVKAVSLSSGTSASASLIAGSTQFDAGVASDVLIANSKGVNLLAVAALSNAITLNLEVNKTWAASHNITTSEPLAQGLKGLKGAKIGITAKGAITDLALQYMLSTVGLKTVTDYDEVALGSPTSNLTALQHNEIQAAIFDPAEATIATEQGQGILAAKGTDFPLLAKSAFGQVFTTAAYAKAHPAIVKEVATSLAEADNLINNNPSQAMPYIQAKFKSFSKSLLTTVLPQYRFADNAQMSAANWKAMAQVLSGGGELSSQGVAKASTDFTNSYLPSGAAG